MALCIILWVLNQTRCEFFVAYHSVHCQIGNGYCLFYSIQFWHFNILSLEGFFFLWLNKFKFLASLSLGLFFSVFDFQLISLDSLDFSYCSFEFLQVDWAILHLIKKLSRMNKCSIEKTENSSKISQSLWLSAINTSAYFLSVFFSDICLSSKSVLFGIRLPEFNPWASPLGKLHFVFQFPYW